MFHLSFAWQKGQGYDTKVCSTTHQQAATSRPAFLRSVPLRTSHPNTAAEMKTQIAHATFSALALALSYINPLQHGQSSSRIFLKTLSRGFVNQKLISSAMSKIRLNDETMPRQAQFSLSAAVVTAGELASADN